MNIKKILETTAMVAGTLNPALGAVIGIVNGFLPDDKRLPASATGIDVNTQLLSLPEGVREDILSKEIDLEMKAIDSWTEIQKAHAQSDATGSSTRPGIAMMMAWAVVLTVVPLSWCMCWAVVDGNSDVIKSIAENYLLVLALIGTPTSLLAAYFGMRTKEKKARYSAAAGQPVNPIGLLTQFLNKGK